MHARVVTNQIQPGKMDEWVALIRDSVVPSLRDQKGFKGFVVLTNAEAGKSIGYSIWDSSNDMLASETSCNYQQQIAKLSAVLAMPPGREAYELTVGD
jgi:quinol monooxygenase YgiN